MRGPNFLLLAMTLAAGTAVRAQMPTYHFGRTPTADEIKAVDTYAGPAGKELPPGKGTPQEGAAIFARKCAHCHGANGEGAAGFPRLVGGKLHPFATTIWSFINSSMPRALPDAGMRAETLSADEVYALTAFLLYKNNVIKETAVMDTRSLPRVHMPKRDPRLDRLAPR